MTSTSSRAAPRWGPALVNECSCGLQRRRSIVAQCDWQRELVGADNERPHENRKVPPRAVYTRLGLMRCALAGVQRPTVGPLDAGVTDAEFLALPGPDIAYCGSGLHALTICDEGCACAAEYCYTLSSR